MSKKRNAIKCVCRMNPKLKQTDKLWRAQCPYCYTVGQFAASKDEAIDRWNAIRQKQCTSKQ